VVVTEAGAVSVSADDFLWFVDLALDGMVRIVEALGDDVANTRPSLEGANSPVAILTHCLGVMEFWGGFRVAGRVIERDRNAEFAAKMPVSELMERVRTARSQFLSDLAHFDSSAALAQVQNVPTKDENAPYALRQGAVLLHVVEELFQHFGQMELTRDVLLAGGGDGS
jgi:hypothetical protein